MWQIQLKWRSHLFKRPFFLLHGHRWPLKRTFEYSCQWSNQNEQNQVIIISFNNTINGITVQQIINSRDCAKYQVQNAVLLLQYVYCAQYVDVLYTWNIWISLQTVQCESVRQTGKCEINCEYFILLTALVFKNKEKNLHIVLWKNIIIK